MICAAVKIGFAETFIENNKQIANAQTAKLEIFTFRLIFLISISPFVYFALSINAIIYGKTAESFFLQSKSRRFFDFLLLLLGKYCLINRCGAFEFGVERREDS